MNATRACGNVPPATYSLFPDCVRTQSHSQTEYTLCTCTQTLCTHTHTHLPISNHVMTLTHPPLGDVKHQEEVSQGRHLPGVFYFILFIYFVSGRDVRGKLREWVSTEHHEPGKQKVVGETSSDVCVCILMENSFRRDTHVWFLWFDKFNFAKKKGT